MSTHKYEFSGLLAYKFLIPLTLLLGLAPFSPEPHLFEKLTMLFEGSLRRPIDILDLVWHSWPIFLLVVKIVSDALNRD